MRVLPPLVFIVQATCTMDICTVVCIPQVQLPLVVQIQYPLVQLLHRCSMDNKQTIDYFAFSVQCVCILTCFQYALGLQYVCLSHSPTTGDHLSLILLLIRAMHTGTISKSIIITLVPKSIFL